MNEDKAARYQRLRRRAVMLSAAWTFLFLSGLLLSGGAASVRDLALAWAARLPVPAVLASSAASAIFVVILAVAHETGAFPAAAYRNFVLDRRYGLSRQPAGGWLRDHAKASALGWALIAAAGAVTAACLRVWPEAWWLGVWAAVVAAGVCLVWAAPVWILPLFFRFTPLRREPLRRRLEHLAQRAGVPVIGVFEWGMSDRTSRANAALAGLGNTRRILVSDTLVEDYSEEEVEVILAHELAHHVHHDVWRALALESAVVGLSLWCASLVLPRAPGWLALQGPTDLAALPLIAVVTLLVSPLGLSLTNVLSRARERRADRFALDLTRSPEAFARVIRRLAARNLADEDPSGFARVFFSTHPPVRQRLEMARDWRPAEGD